jgi:hypothetical protein
MKKIFLTFMGLVLMAHTAFSSEKEIKTKIETVTVFLSGAQINRTAKVAVKAGRTKLLFKGLSPDINKNSLSVRVKGGVKVMSINHRSDYFDETKKNPKVKKLSDSIELMNTQLENIIVELNLLKARERFVQNNYIVKGNDNLDPIKLVKVSDFYNQELSFVRRSLLKEERKYKKLNDVLTKYRNQLRALISKQATHTSIVEVLVEAVKAASFEFSLSYVVVSAGWTPSYDVRADDISKPIEVAYKATLFQKTGIDWKGVKLTFSNGNPYQSNVLPKLTPQYLRFISYQALRQAKTNYKAKTANNYLGLNQSRTISGVVLDVSSGEALAYATVLVNGTTIGTLTDDYGNFTLEVPNNKRNIIISYIGYQNQNVHLNGDYHKVLMAENQNQLNSVVIAEKSKRTQRHANVAMSKSYRSKELAPRNAVVSSRKRGISMQGSRMVSKKVMYDANADAVGRGYMKSGGSQPLSLLQRVKPVSVEFTIDESYDVKSSGKPIVVEMNNIDIAADFEYRAVPKLDEAAFLVAMIKDWSKYNFLEGEVNLYFENTFVGKTIFDLSSMSDTLTVSLGKDKSIQVSRDKVKDFSDRKFIGGTQVEKRAFDIKIRNTKSAEINLVLYDQVPVSQHKDIVVNVQEHSKSKMNEKTGQLKWVLSLKPGEKVTKNIAYSVKYPKGRYVNIE